LEKFGGVAYPVREKRMRKTDKQLENASNIERPARPLQQQQQQQKTQEKKTGIERVWN
jgi:hypothetical protein